ncbi:30S ribosomal protein S3 [Candidatus Woesearchaeota archaeon]|jgi:small subunit ribosomal protein S3|nr:30S ribosomal protein S3 [Candidatus Woesearchaeota archaeon]
MILRKVVDQKLKEFEIGEFIQGSLKRVGLSHIKLQMTPLGEKIIIYASRPGLIVGRKGQNIRKLTSTLKKRFGLENPQIEINEIENLNLNANIVAERIANSLEKFGPVRFKAIGHKALESVMQSGALGVEILITGKIPSSRAKRWRFYQGYLKKCGDIALTGVNTAYTSAQIKSGTVGIQVRIMPPDTVLPDKIVIRSELSEVAEIKNTEKESTQEKDSEKEKKPKTKKPKKSVTKKSTKKSSKKEGKEEKEVTGEIKEKSDAKQEKSEEKVKDKIKEENKK